MICDLHCHITYQNYPEFAQKLLRRGPFDIEVLLRRLDLEEINVGVLQPLVNPECLDAFGVAGNQECLMAARHYPDRIKSFASIDPRSLLINDDNKITDLIKLYRDLGAIGLGELCADLMVDDHRYQKIYHLAGLLKMPLLFHFQYHHDQGGYGTRIAQDFSDLRKMLKLFPDTKFIGHSYVFWRSFETDIMAMLLSENPNLLIDLSGEAAFKLMSDNVVKCINLFKTYNHQFLFGTDRFSGIDEAIPPILEFIRKLYADQRLSENEFQSMMGNNFASICK